MSFKLVKYPKCVLKLCLYSKVVLDKSVFKLKKESTAIFDYILYRSGKCGNSDLQGFVLCPAKTLKKLFGSNYSSGIRELECLNLIEPKRYYDPCGNYYKYSENNGIASSYKITSFANSLIRKQAYSFVKEEFLYKVPESRRGKFKLKIKSTSSKDNKLLDAYQGISIDSNWVNLFQNSMCFPPDHYKYPLEPIARTGFFFHSKSLIECILNKIIKIKTDSECGRAFHPIIEMPKILRSYIRLRGQKLISIDATAFHPHLIASCIKDTNQRVKYLDFVRGDFYEYFADQKHSRELIKVCLQKYLSGKKTNDSKVLEIQNWFNSNFPDVPLKMSELKKEKKTFQMHLQQLESRIFVDEVFMKASFWCIPMHDGIAVLEEDQNSAIQFIDRVCLSELGYSIPLKSENPVDYINLSN